MTFYIGCVLFMVAAHKLTPFSYACERWKNFTFFFYSRLENINLRGKYAPSNSPLMSEWPHMYLGWLRIPSHYDTCSFALTESAIQRATIKYMLNVWVEKEIPQWKLRFREKQFHIQICITARARLYNRAREFTAIFIFTLDIRCRIPIEKYILFPLRNDENDQLIALPPKMPQSFWLRFQGILPAFTSFGTFFGATFMHR